MGKVALGKVFLRPLQLSTVSFIPPMVRTRLHLCVILIRRANGQSLEGSKKQRSFGNLGGLDKKYFSVFCWDIPVGRRTVAGRAVSCTMQDTAVQSARTVTWELRNIAGRGWVRVHWCQERADV